MGQNLQRLNLERKGTAHGLNIAQPLNTPRPSQGLAADRESQASPNTENTLG